MNSKKKTTKPKTKSIRFITGSNFRSKNGCLTCKLKKRKCDETIPQCMFCVARGLQCIYKTDQIKSTELIHVAKKPITKPEEYIIDERFANGFRNNCHTFLPEEIRQTKLSDLTDRISSQDFHRTPFYLNEIPTPAVRNPSSLPSLCLDRQGLFYLDYFLSRLSGILAISFDHTNYFKKLFYLLARHEETFTYIVAAWGAIYCKDRTLDDEVQKYLDKGINKFQILFGNKTNGFDYYFQMCFYLIISELNVCIGELRQWRVYFDKICELINEYGGLQKLCEDFNYSHEIRFMISNLQYNDIMSSTSFAHGTAFPTTEYEVIFSHPNFIKYELSYGIDTLQGCHQKVLILLGEIMNHKVILSDQLLILESMEKSTPDGMIKYLAAKKDYYKLIDKYATELQSRIENVLPNHQVLESIRDNQMEYDVYYNTYLLYKKCCWIYWYLYIKQITPNNYQVQEVMLECLELIDELIPSKMNIILCYPLLICGLAAFEPNDRLFIEDRVEKVKHLSPVNNLDKCWIILEKIWELNPNGGVIVDWAGICLELGWELNVC